MELKNTLEGFKIIWIKQKNGLMSCKIKQWNSPEGATKKKNEF